MAGRISQTIVDVVIGGIQRFTPEALPSDLDLSPLGGDETGVPLEPYRRVLELARQRGGAKCLLEAGRLIHNLSDPILFVLLNSDRVDLVIEKEARLGRFIHSRHIVRILEQGERHIVLEHGSLVPDPPRETEDLAAAGQHVALLEQVGCRGLGLRFPQSPTPDAWAFLGGEYAEPGAGPYAVWHFEWERFEPTRRPMTGLDELLLAREARPQLDESVASASQVARLIREDLGRTWTLADVAQRMGAAPRSLQRALSAEGTNFSELVDGLRVDEAKRLLETSELSVTQIGYVCGFADTSHFSRRFKKRVGRSPSQYREEKH
ncbi:MAG: helix-turn-helix transcriptional regulator [Polyangiaceae bacterium]